MTSPTGGALRDLYPVAGNNAIESAALSLTWEGAKDERLFTPFLNLRDLLEAQGYSPAIDVQALSVEVGPNRPLSSSTVRAGYSFAKRSANNAPLREVTIRDSQLIFLVRDYTRWAKFLEDADAICAKFFPALREFGKVFTTVGLQYQDKFHWRNSGAFPTATALKNSEFLPLKALAASSQWHCHYGFFVAGSAGIPQRLDNINVSLALENNIPTLGILCAHQFGPAAFGADLVSMNALKPLLQNAHDANKGYLRNLLVDDLCGKIGLENS